MQKASWVALFQFIPDKEQSNLMLVTSGGMEISIQALLRIDSECMAIKGRIAGSQDAGRVFFIPYDRIDYVGFQQPVKETAFHELFDSFTFPNEPDTSDVSEPLVSSTEMESPPAAAEGSGTDQRGLPAIKSAVLERFRARSSPPQSPSRPPSAGQ